MPQIIITSDDICFITKKTYNKNAKKSKYLHMFGNFFILIFISYAQIAISFEVSPGRGRILTLVPKRSSTKHQHRYHQIAHKSNIFPQLDFSKSTCTHHIEFDGHLAKCSPVKASRSEAPTHPPRGRDQDRRRRGQSIKLKKKAKTKLRSAWQKLNRLFTKPKKHSIYVLECENDKYYVGSTNNMKRRFKEHTSPRGGSKWTRRHKPLRIVKEYKRIPHDYYLGKEAQVTAELMLLHGVNNVRGAMFAESREYDLDDLPALKGFLGHYNELSYKRLAHKLHAVLDHASSERALLKKNDRCFLCGELGHWAAECPNKGWVTMNRGPTKCFTCGKIGHKANNCPNKHKYRKYGKL